MMDRSRGPLDSGPGGADFLQLDPGDAPRGRIAEWLTDEISTAITSGQLTGGSRLPATRMLADDLRISRGVVVEAYRRLLERGMVSARTGAATVVAERPSAPPRSGVADPMRPSSAEGARSTRLPRTPAARSEEVLDLSPGVPDLTGFPRAAWTRHLRGALADATAVDLGYGDPRGHPQLRRELAGWLARTRGIRVDAEDILVVAGVAQSLALLAQVLRRAGADRIAVEDPGSRGAREELAYWGLRPVGVPVDDAGIRVDLLAALAASSQASAVLVTPAHHFPSGVVLAPHRRHELLAWAQAAPDRLVIEDDYDAEHRYDRMPVAALHPLAPHLVAHTGSVSKTLAPAIRLGWLVPPRRLSAELVDAKHASDLGSPALDQLVLARLIASGDLDRHLRAAKRRQRQRRDALIGAIHDHLPGVEVSGVAAGLHLMLTFPRTSQVDDVEVTLRAEQAGVIVQPLSWHRIEPGEPGLVLGYAARSPEQLRRAVEVLARVLG